MNQNKKLVALWYEVKNHFERDQYGRQSLSSEELVSLNSKSNLQQYFMGLLKIVERWMRIMCEDEGEVVGALIVDQVFKNAMIKLDQVLTAQEEFMDLEHEASNCKVTEMRQVTKDKMNLLMKHFEISEEKYVSQIEELNRQIKAQSKEIESLHLTINQEMQKYNFLISRQGREKSIKELQTSFCDLSSMIKEQEEHHGNQVKLLQQFTQMIDLGAKPVRRVSVEVQTDPVIYPTEKVEQPSLEKLREHRKSPLSPESGTDPPHRC